MDYIEEAKKRAKQIMPAGGGFFGSSLPARFDIALQLMTLEKLDKVLEALDGPAGAAPIAQEEETLTDRPALNKVDKPCEKCGKMMEQVHPARKYCDKCKGAK